MNQLVGKPPAARIAAWLITLVALVLILHLHLLSALLAGLLVFQLVHILAPVLQRRLAGRRGRWIAVALLATVIVGLLTLAIVGLVAFFRSDAGSVTALLDRMMQIIDQARGQLPAMIANNLPADPEDARQVITEWVQAHGQQLQLAGKETVKVLVHIILGMVIGALIALDEAMPEHRTGPLAIELHERATRFADAFRRVVFAQIKISLLNTIFTAVFLVGILPLAGVHLPLAKTLILVTFLVGLLPVIGNLISNTIITVIAVLGLNSARSLTFKGGRINEQQITRLQERLCALDNRLIKVVVSHHPFDLPAGHDEDHIVGRAEPAMRMFAKCGVDLLLAGHLHLSSTGSSAERYKIGDYSALVVQAGTATSTRSRGETNSFNVIRITPTTITVERQLWNPAAGEFQRGASEEFSREKHGRT